MVANRPGLCSLDVHLGRQYESIPGTLTLTLTIFTECRRESRGKYDDKPAEVRYLVTGTNIF